MSTSSLDQPATYATQIGMVYVFNLIVGTGALALPRAFQDAGWGLGIIVLTGSCFISYICVTFVIESMGIANALMESRRIQRLKQAAQQSVSGREFSTDSEGEFNSVRIDQEEPLLYFCSDLNLSVVTIVVKDHYYEIRERVELSQMAHMFLGKIGLIGCYVILIVYLFGDLTIYTATVPKSLMNVICSGGQTNMTVLQGNRPCYNSWPHVLTRFHVYQICVCLFIVVVGPLIFTGMTKTKYLQFITTISRWIAFMLMIGLASRSLIAKGQTASPVVANPNHFGSLFGITVYSFMCHHSVPGLVTPMKRKRNIYSLFLLIYVLILLFYTALSVTGSLAFPVVQDVYTLNFLNSRSDNRLLLVINYFLALFPVLTISTNYPIIGITLKNNLHTLLATLMSNDTGRLLLTINNIMERRIHCWSSIRLLLLPSLIIGLPTLVALKTDDVEFLASTTGSYAGVGMQFALPAMLIMSARKTSKNWQREMKTVHKNASPFQNPLWPLFMFVWSAFTIIIVTTNLFHVKL